MTRHYNPTIISCNKCLRISNGKCNFIGLCIGLARNMGKNGYPGRPRQRNDFSSFSYTRCSRKRIPAGLDYSRYELAFQNFLTNSQFGSKYSIIADKFFQNVSCIRSSISKQATIQRQRHRGIYSIAGASPRQMADLEERVWSQVGSNVQDPETKVFLHKLGWLHRSLSVSRSVDSTNEGQNSNKTSVQIILQLPTLLHPTLTTLESLVRKEAKQEIDRWIRDNNLSIIGLNDTILQIYVEVKSIAKPPIPWLVQSGQQSQEDVKSRLGPGLANISHFLAVYSCKGGVGKSTVAVNLAYELARLGGRVGLLDVDIYGPSLPLMVNPNDDSIRKSSLGASMVRPIEHEGVKLLSLGYVSSNSGIPGSGKSDNAAILRGPMAGRVVTQLLKGTEWGDLDVLILDLPPGTGDVQLTVCQEVDLSFAVGVTTPSNLAIADARKGISMFNSMGIETVAMVENMAYFECNDGCKHYPFGRGFAGDASTTDKSLRSKVLSAKHVCRLPISESANMAIDTGVPICLSRPENARRELDTFTELATIVSRELFQLPHREPSSEGMVLLEDEYFDLSTIHLSDNGEYLLIRFFSENGALQKRVPAENLFRLDPMSGNITDKTSSVAMNEEERIKSKNVIVSIHSSKSSASYRSNKIIPERIEEKGRVGFEVTWSDGSRFIYRRSVIAVAGGGSIVETQF